MTDREQRLHRAQVRLADARRLCDLAAGDLYANVPEWERLGDVAMRNARSLRWLCGEVGRELRRGGEGGDG